MAQINHNDTVNYSAESAFMASSILNEKENENEGACATAALRYCSLYREQRLSSSPFEGSFRPNKRSRPPFVNVWNNVSSKVRRVMAFTLIELLVVIAIIAILLTRHEINLHLMGYALL